VRVFPAETGRLVKIPAAWLIEQAGFSGRDIRRTGGRGGEFRRCHTLALINRVMECVAARTAKEILALAEKNFRDGS
jgi:UDP-N-acetylenolpyruvoylglucosamine reductase